MLGDITVVDQIYIACGYTDMRKSIDGLVSRTCGSTVQAMTEKLRSSCMTTDRQGQAITPKNTSKDSAAISTLTATPDTTNSPESHDAAAGLICAASSMKPFRSGKRRKLTAHMHSKALPTATSFSKLKLILRT